MKILGFGGVNYDTNLFCHNHIPPVWKGSIYSVPLYIGYRKIVFDFTSDCGQDLTLSQEGTLDLNITLGQ